MPKAAQYRLTWHAGSRTYELREHPGGPLFAVMPGEHSWFAWLDTVASFTFWGQQGQLTVRKESRQWGEGYWYAYRRVGSKLTKKYVGRTADLTLTRLEEIAAQLTHTEMSAQDEAAIQVPSGERMQALGHSGAEVELDASVVATKTTMAQFATISSVQPDRLLFTKLHVPRPRARFVPRSHLTELLQRGMEHALTLVSAPAGFGKTTLLAQWLAESDTLVAWLSLEPEDNDPVRFLTYLIAALQTVDAHLGTAALDLLRTPQPPPPETVVILLINDLLRSTVGDFALVLDDYHIITAEPLHRALSVLVEHLPPQLHLILATRADPPLPLSRLRARGQLTEVRAADLRFSPEEANAFLHTIMDLDLPPRDIAAIERRTEGWIAGLQLAALSLQGRTDVAGFLAAFTGSHRFVLDYLSEEVLSRQPVPVQAFLLYTSILERLSAPLCEVVTEREGSQAMLEALERDNLFVIPLDDERRWYRYHHLFAEVLKNCLDREQPQRVPELHRRASLWFEQHNLSMEAVQHALAAHDFEHAARLIEQSAMLMMSQGQTLLELSWLDALPDALVRTRPTLCILHATTRMRTNQLQAAEARLQDAERCLHASTQASQRRLIQGQIATVRANLAGFAGDTTRTVALAQQALDLLPETETTMRAVARMLVAHASYGDGDVTTSREQFAVETVAPMRATRNAAGVLSTLTALARLYFMQGRLHRAAATYEEAARLIPEREGLDALPGSPSYYFGLGDILREWNELAEAEQLLSHSIQLVKGRLTVAREVAMQASVSLTRLHMARGDTNKALETVDAFAQVAQEHHFLPTQIAQVAAARAQVELAQGNLAFALHWAETSGLTIEDELSYPLEREYLTLARVCLAKGRDDSAGPFLQQALHLLDRLLADAESKARMGSALEVLILRALALVAQGKRTEALAVLQRALTLAAPEGYIRLFVDEGAPMLAWLRQIRPHVYSSVQGYVSTLLSAFGDQPASPAPGPSSLVEPLTEREREVLRLLLEGTSNREIARSLVLSINTVKRHIYNICGKLGVQSRTQAIVKARTLSLF